MHLKLLYDEDKAEIIEGLDFVDNRLYVARSLIPQEFESSFQESAHYISAHTSTAIEGNPLGEEEAMEVLVERTDVDRPNQKEKVNLDEAYKLMFLIASDKTTTIDEGIIRTINSMVLKGLPGSQARARGKYRKGPARIIDSSTRKVRYLAPKAAWVPGLMKHFVQDIRGWIEDKPGAIAAALAHFGLISIHPFEDGNGRTARLMADMILHLTDFSADGMVSVSSEIHKRLKDYYDVLQSVQGEKFEEEVDVTDFILFHNDALARAAVTLEEKAINFSRFREDITEKMQGLLNERQVTGLMFLFDIGRITSSRYASLTECSQATAVADLNALVEDGLVIRKGAGKNTRYLINPSFPETNQQMVEKEK